MGWKAIKERYGIRHILAWHEGEGWCVGSAYVHALLTIDVEARTITCGSLVREGEELYALRSRMLADGDAFWSMWGEPDVFAASLPVFTTRDGELIETRCEEHGWPNLTHDGWLMYDNTFFTDPMEALAEGKRGAASSIASYEERLAQWEEEGAKLRARLADARGRWSELDHEETKRKETP